MDQVGIHHLSLWVNDIKTIFEKLESAGVPVMSPPRESEPGGAIESFSGAKALTINVQDPDGILVQLDQRVG